MSSGDPPKSEDGSHSTLDFTLGAAVVEAPVDELNGHDVSEAPNRLDASDAGRGELLDFNGVSDLVDTSVDSGDASGEAPSLLLLSNKLDASCTADGKAVVPNTSPLLSGDVAKSEDASVVACGPALEGATLSGDELSCVSVAGHESVNSS